MYVPSHFAESRIEVLHQLIRARPLATLVTLNADGLNANHIPFELDPDPPPLGTLRGHVARANPVWRAFSREVEVLVIFRGPEAYVSPSWYPSKTESGEVVPTYNYIVAHGYGEMKIVEEREWLRGLVTRLTNRFEAGGDGPGQRTRGPGTFIDKKLRPNSWLEIHRTQHIGQLTVQPNGPS